jgi:hypothetical protein
MYMAVVTPLFSLSLFPCRRMDVDDSGSISLLEFRKGLQRSGFTDHVISLESLYPFLTFLLSSCLLTTHPPTPIPQTICITRDLCIKRVLIVTHCLSVWLTRCDFSTISTKMAMANYRTTNSCTSFKIP